MQPQSFGQDMTVLHGAHQITCDLCDMRDRSKDTHQIGMLFIEGISNRLVEETQTYIMNKKQATVGGVMVILEKSRTLLREKKVKFLHFDQ